MAYDKPTIKEAISSSKEVFQRSSYMIEGIHHIEEASARIENIQNSVLENLENISASTEENAAGTLRGFRKRGRSFSYHG